MQVECEKEHPRSRFESNCKLIVLAQHRAVKAHTKTKMTIQLSGLDMGVSTIPYMHTSLEAPAETRTENHVQTAAEGEVSGVGFAASS